MSMLRYFSGIDGENDEFDIETFSNFILKVFRCCFLAFIQNASLKLLDSTEMKPKNTDLHILKMPLDPKTNFHAKSGFKKLSIELLPS